MYSCLGIFAALVLDSQPEPPTDSSVCDARNCGRTRDRATTRTQQNIQLTEPIESKRVRKALNER